MLATYTLWQRELVRFYRQRDRVIGALATPLLFWAFIGAGFGSSFRATTGYFEYLFPGMIVLTLLFTAIFSTISIIEDRREGFLQSVLVAPVSRFQMVLGKVVGAGSIALFQSFLFFFLAPLAGISLSPPSVLLSILVLALIAFGLANLGFLIAWRSDSTQGFHAIMNLFLMPMWLLSGAFFPAAGAPTWIRMIIQLNPLTYGMAALRHSLYLGTVRDPALPPMTLSLIVTACFSAAVFFLAVLSAGRRSTKDLP